MNPSWNPASDLQAIDRAYRLGSRRDVNVYRLISAGTMEEIVYSRQIYKQQQSNIAVEDAKDEPRYFEGKTFPVPGQSEGDKRKEGPIMLSPPWVAE